MNATTSTPRPATPAGADARPGALTPAQMEGALVRAPSYRISAQAPAAVHADVARQFWGGDLVPLMASPQTAGRFAGAVLSCPPTACVGLLRMDSAARSKAWRNPHAIENVICVEGRIELRHGARLEQSLVLERHDMVSMPAGVRHSIANAGPGEARALMVLSIGKEGSYEAVFGSADASASAAAREALALRFDDEPGVEIDVETVANRVTRFATLVPYKNDLKRTGGIPPEATEMLSAGSVFPLIVPEGHVGRSRTAPMYGNQGLYLAIAECQGGDDGPPAHAHMDTQESFFPLDGSWEFYTGFDNEASITLGPCDLLAMPRTLMRTFRNTSGKPARILAIIQGADQMRDRVAYSRRVGDTMRDRFGPGVIEMYNQIGMTFDAEDLLCH